MNHDETMMYARAHREDDVRELAFRRVPEGVDQQMALRQISGWQAARRKLPAWAATWEGDGTTDAMVQFPVRVSMEQCSSDAAAAYKRRVVRSHLLHIADVHKYNVDVNEFIADVHKYNADVQSVAAGSMTDLTGGLGVDFAALAPLFAHATYVERDAALCALARHNLPLVSSGYTLFIYNSAAEEVLATLPRQTLIYLDPARRDGAGRRVFMTADCQPDVARLHDQLVDRADMVMLKLSPMLDIHDALRSLPATCEVHVVEVGGEVKELLLVLRRHGGEDCRHADTHGAAADWCGDGEGGVPDLRQASEVKIICTDTVRQFEFTYHEEADAVVDYADSMGRYLYEPSPSLMKAGAYRTVAVRYGLKKLHRDSHLYTSDTLVADFPGRTLQVEGVATVREAKKMLGGVTHANIVTRNFPQRPDDLKRRLRLTDGGSCYLYATTLADGNHVLVKAFLPGNDSR